MTNGINTSVEKYVNILRECRSLNIMLQNTMKSIRDISQVNEVEKKVRNNNTIYGLAYVGLIKEGVDCFPVQEMGIPKLLVRIGIEEYTCEVKEVKKFMDEYDAIPFKQGYGLRGAALENYLNSYGNEYGMNEGELKQSHYMSPVHIADENQSTGEYDVSNIQENRELLVLEKTIDVFNELESANIIVSWDNEDETPEELFLILPNGKKINTFERVSGGIIKYPVKELDKGVYKIRVSGYELGEVAVSLRDEVEYQEKPIEKLDKTDLIMDVYKLKIRHPDREEEDVDYEIHVVPLRCKEKSNQSAANTEILVCMMCEGVRRVFVSELDKRASVTLIAGIHEIIVLGQWNKGVFTTKLYPAGKTLSGKYELIEVKEEIRPVKAKKYHVGHCVLESKLNTSTDAVIHVVPLSMKNKSSGYTPIMCCIDKERKLEERIVRERECVVTNQLDGISLEVNKTGNYGVEIYGKWKGQEFSSTIEHKNFTV